MLSIFDLDDRTAQVLHPPQLAEHSQVICTDLIEQTPYPVPCPYLIQKPHPKKEKLEQYNIVMNWLVLVYVTTI